MLGNKRSRRLGGEVYEPPTLLLLQQIFATAKCRKVLTSQYGAQWRECSLPGQSIPSGEEAGDTFTKGFQMKVGRLKKALSREKAKSKRQAEAIRKYETNESLSIDKRLEILLDEAGVYSTMVKGRNQLTLLAGARMQKGDMVEYFVQHASYTRDSLKNVPRITPTDRQEGEVPTLASILGELWKGNPTAYRPDLAGEKEKESDRERHFRKIV